MAATNPQVVDSVYSLPVADIRIGDRLRPVDRDWAIALGAIIAAEGQKTPIEVCRLPGKSGWTLVAGAHRVAAAEACGLTHIKAIIVDESKIERKMREVSENLWRKGLDPLARARFIAELHELLRARSGVVVDALPQSIAATARWQKQIKSEADDASATIALAYGWTDQIVEQVGLSRRTVFNDLAIHRRLSPASIHHLRAINHPILKNSAQLKALAKLDTAKQIEVIDLLRHGVAKTVSDAIATLNQTKAPTPQGKLLGRVISTLDRMSENDRAAAIETIAKTYPKEFRRALDRQARQSRGGENNA